MHFKVVVNANCIGQEELGFCLVQPFSLCPDIIVGEITFHLQHMVYGCDCFLSAFDSLILVWYRTVHSHI